MNTQEAKLILQAYRPGGQDAGDPMFAEALALAQCDPALQKWLTQEQALDSLVQASLQRAVPIPPALKPRLLAQRKAIRPTPRWRTPFWLATTAAVLALTATLTVLWLKQSNGPEFAELRQILVQNSMQMDDHISKMAPDMAQIRSWLKGQGAPADFDMPISLRDAMLRGCKVLNWQGQKITMVCLRVGSNHMDLFVIDSTHFRDFRPAKTAQFEAAGGASTAVWRTANNTFLLAGKMDESELRKML